MRKNSWAIKHDMSHTSLYKRWRDMKSRCFNPNSCNYKHYGARGITVCKEWLSFENFAKWSMQHGYSEELSIDRIDNDGNYEPGNCRWTTRNIQNINMRHKNTSGYVGISKHSLDGAWYGRLKVNGKVVYTGRSKNIHEAAIMRNKYIIEHDLPNKINKIMEV